MREDMPVEVIMQPDIAESYSARRWAVQDRATELVFGPINRGHRKNQDIVKCHGNGRRNFIAAENPGDADRQQSLKAVERRESEKNSNRRAQRDGVRCVGDRHQGHVMVV